jgi:hypothetical protein
MIHVFGYILLLLAQDPLPGPKARPTPAVPDDVLTLDGPSVVFVAPAGPAGDALRLQKDRLSEALHKKKMRAVFTPPTLVRMANGKTDGKGLRKIDFRPTPGWLGTVIVGDDRAPRVHQGPLSDEALLEQVEAYLKAARAPKPGP